MQNPIEKYRKLDESGQEYWSSADLKKLCGLSGENYSNAIKKTIRFINSFGYMPKEQIKPIKKDGKIVEYRFTRRAVYLLVMGLEFDGAHAIGNFVATTQLYLMTTAYELNKSDMAEAINRELYEKEKDEFSIEAWINEYKEERLILKTWPEQRWKQFETLLFGLTRKLGSKEEAVKYAKVLDKHSGEKYKDDAENVATSMLVRFKFVANDPSYNREKVIDQKKASLERKRKFEQRQQKGNTHPPYRQNNRQMQQRRPMNMQRRSGT